MTAEEVVNEFRFDTPKWVLADALEEARLAGEDVSEDDVGLMRGYGVWLERARERLSWVEGMRDYDIRRVGMHGRLVRVYEPNDENYFGRYAIGRIDATAPVRDPRKVVLEWCKKSLKATT